jgi:Zn-finger nucleic acid-binding protein
MWCPACDNVEMFVLEFELIELDWCPECRGVWLDSGELELVGRRAGALQAELLDALERGKGHRTGDGKRPCPTCGKALREVQTDTEPPIVVDRCPNEHGLWFDAGELQAVVQAAGAQEDSVLARFFGELKRSDGQQ